jgi:quercetin dioxygenase-like cupin family protein
MDNRSPSAPAYWFLDTLVVVHRPTAPVVLELIIPPGGSPPRHAHRDLDDNYYLLEGALAVSCGDRRFRADPGTYVAQPRGVPHTFRVLGDQPARLLSIHDNDSFLRLVQALGEEAPAPTLPMAMPEIDRPTLIRALADASVDTVGDSMTEDEARAIARP